jgi:hypothetical protein
MYEVWVLVDEEGKPVLDSHGKLEKVSAAEFAGDSVYDSDGNWKFYWSKRFTLSELKYMDWY